VNRKVLLIVLALAVVLLTTPYFGVVHAVPPTPVSGEIELVSAVPLSQKPLGKSDNQIWIMALTEHWTGDIDAVGITEAVWVFHNINSPDYSINIHEMLTFQASAILGDSYSGTFIMELNIDTPKGYWTILRGTGDCAHLHGHGTISLATMPYSYKGVVFFAP